MPAFSSGARTFLLAKAPFWNFPKRGGNKVSRRERGGGLEERTENLLLPSPLPSFALAPTLRDTNMNKVSPTQNTPALQAIYDWINITGYHKQSLFGSHTRLYAKQNIWSTVKHLFGAIFFLWGDNKLLKDKWITQAIHSKLKFKLYCSFWLVRLLGVPQCSIS